MTWGLSITATMLELVVLLIFLFTLHRYRVDQAVDKQEALQISTRKKVVHIPTTGETQLSVKLELSNGLEQGAESKDIPKVNIWEV